MQEFFTRPEVVDDYRTTLLQAEPDWTSDPAHSTPNESSTSSPLATVEPDHVEFTALYPAEAVQEEESAVYATEVKPAPVIPERAPPLSNEQINQLIHGPHGLGSSNYRERDVAHRTLERSGVNALPALLAVIRAEGMPLEVTRRAELLRNQLLNSGVGVVLDGMRSNDAAISQACELMLSRQSTASLLAGSTHAELSVENRAAFNQLIRRRLSDEQLEAYADTSFDLRFGQNPDENNLRLSIAASQVLGRPNQVANYHLGSILMQRGESGRAEAERALVRSLDGGDQIPMRASAQRMLAELGFLRGDNARGLAMSREALRSLRAGSIDPRSDLLREEFMALSQLAGRSGTINAERPMTPAQLAEMRSLGQDATAEGRTYSAAHNTWLNENRFNKKAVPPRRLPKGK
jgi:hypothetical protein